MTELSSSSSFPGNSLATVHRLPPHAPPARLSLPAPQAVRACRSPVAGNMPPTQDWASLAADLVELIGWRVLAGDLQDYVRFRAACSHWSASTVRPHILDPRFHPRRWMMLPEGHGLYPGHPDLRGFVRFLNLSTGALVRLHLPLLDDHVILDSVDGLLLLHRDHDTVVRLLHPFTGEIVHLPPLASILPQETRRFYTEKLKRSLLMNPCASVSVSSRGTVTVMLAFRLLKRVAYATGGDQQWTLSDWKLQSFLAPMSSNGKIYMLQLACKKVHIYQIDPPCTTTPDEFPHSLLPMKIAECPLIIFGLVECGSEILVVAYKDESRIDLAVFRLADLVIGRFVPITSIGNYALFLGERCLWVSLPPNKGLSKWLPSVSPNSVICLRWSHLNSGEQLFEQYSLSTGMWTPASDGNILKMPPPSPHEFTHHIFTCCYHSYWNKGLMYCKETYPDWLIKLDAHLLAAEYLLLFVSCIISVLWPDRTLCGQWAQHVGTGSTSRLPATQEQFVWLQPCLRGHD